jgi:hypothetical protein
MYSHYEQANLVNETSKPHLRNCWANAVSAVEGIEPCHDPQVIPGRISRKIPPNTNRNSQSLAYPPQTRMVDVDTKLGCELCHGVRGDLALGILTRLSLSVMLKGFPRVVTERVIVFRQI